MRWRERVIKNVIAHAAPKSDPFRFVKGPVDAKVNPALAVLFLGLRQSRKTARPIGTRISMIVEGRAIEFIGNERERDAIGAVKPAHDLEECSAESGMTRRISREWGGKGLASEIAGRRAHGRKLRIAHCVGIAIA